MFIIQFLSLIKHTNKYFLKIKLKKLFILLNLIGVSFEEAEESFIMKMTYIHTFDSKKVTINIRKELEEGKYGHLEIPHTEYIGIIGDHYKKI